MPKLSAAELRQLSGEELRNKVRELKEELFGLRFQSATGQLENTAPPPGGAHRRMGERTLNSVEDPDAANPENDKEA